MEPSTLALAIETEIEAYLDGSGRRTLRETAEFIASLAGQHTDGGPGLSDAALRDRYAGQVFTLGIEQALRMMPLDASIKGLASRAYVAADAMVAARRKAAT